MSTVMLHISPAQAPARSARSSIDSLRDLIREIPLRLDRPAIKERLAHALRSLYAVLDTSIDAPVHHEGLVECGYALAEVRALLDGSGDPAGIPPLAEALALLDRVSQSILVAEQEVADIQLSRRAQLRGGLVDSAPLPVRPLRASVGLPRLHAPPRNALVPRMSLEPLVEIPEERKPRGPRPPLPTTLEELRQAADAAREPPPEEEAPPEAEPIVPAYIPAINEREMVRRIARDCLEDIAILSTLRKPIPTENWLDQAPFEQRLLDNLDAFVSLGEAALPAVMFFHAEASSPDPTRGFTVAFALGCLEGADAADVAVATLKESDPAEHPGWFEGFVLAPSPAIDTAMADLLDSPSPALAGFAVDVLSERGALPVRLLDALLARRDLLLTVRVARALGRTAPRQHALDRLALLASLDAPDVLFAAALESLLRRGDGNARQLLRDAITMSPGGPRLETASSLLALSGRSADLELLLLALRKAPSVAVVRGLGRFGHVGAIGPLIELLRLEDEALVLAASEALDRITGAGLRETVKVPWAEGAEPSPDAPMREVEKVVVDPARWEDWRKRVGSRLDPRVKLRAGLPFHPMMIVEELTLVGTPPARRPEVALELALSTGLQSRFSPTDWVVRQHEHLADLRTRTGALAGERGAWWFGGASSSR